MSTVQFPRKVINPTLAAMCPAKSEKSDIRPEPPGLCRPARPRWSASTRGQRVFLRSFLCFFLRMRLRRFLIREPMAGSDATGPARRKAYRSAHPGTGGKVAPTVGGGVTAARGPLESQVEVRNLAPEQRPPAREETGVGQYR